VHHSIGEFVVFFLVSLSAAFVGWGMVAITSRIERQRGERYGNHSGSKRRPISGPPKSPSARSTSDAEV
jgi:hypothetical protein